MVSRVKRICFVVGVSSGFFFSLLIYHSLFGRGTGPSLDDSWKWRGSPASREADDTVRLTPHVEEAPGPVPDAPAIKLEKVDVRNFFTGTIANVPLPHLNTSFAGPRDLSKEDQHIVASIKEYHYKDATKQADKDLTPAEDYVNNVMSNMFPGGVVENVALKSYKPAGMDITTVNHYWQMVQDSGAEIYLYSAYYDDRPAVGDPVLRIIGVADEQVRKQMVFCLLWYPAQEFPDVSIVVMDQIGPKIRPTAGDVMFEPMLLSCRVAKGKSAPDQVSIVTTANLQPTTLLPVQIPEKPRETIDFGHCMSVVYWKHDPYRVVEWLEIHKLWGVGEVTIYNNSLEQEITEVLQHYVKEGFVDFRQAPSVLTGDDVGELTILLNMSPVINDCMYRNMYRYKWIVVTDFDEMIVPRKHDNYHDLLRAIDEDDGRLTPAKAYMFNNVYFFSDLGPVKSEPWFMWVTRYLRHAEPNESGYSAKSITDPLACYGLQNHLCWKRIPYLNNSALWNVEVNRSLAMNFHYKRCHLDRYEGKYGVCKDTMKEYTIDRSIRRFGKRLYSRVVKQLMKLGLVEFQKENEEGDNVEDQEKDKTEVKKNRGVKQKINKSKMENT